MGFYGNITNTNKTQFTFDRTYPNRHSMDLNAQKDGVYLGRYVLVEYDLNAIETLENGNDYLRVFCSKYTDNIDIKDLDFYSEPNEDIQHIIKYTDVKVDDNEFHGADNGVLMGQIVYLMVDDDLAVQNNKKEYKIFLQCSGSKKKKINNKDVDIAVFTRVKSINGSNYVDNFNIDEKIYGPSRGFDSTVWQKVYTNDTEKYVMIAELNSVVPTFDISIDAPTMIPLTPHFDTDSTSVYYNLHWQPQWGLRVADADGNPSDSQTYWTREEYDKDTGVGVRQYYNKESNAWQFVKEGDEIPQLDAAIYFNRDAFDPQVNKDGEINKHVIGDNYFNILPTGESGQLYNTHDGKGIQKPAVDIQEMRINLPAIGNMMSDAWDIIHGPLRNDDKRQVDDQGNRVDSLQGRLNSIADLKANEIPIKRAADGKLVGTQINGDNNRIEEEITEILDEALSTSLTEDDAWIYTKIDSDAITEDHNSGIAIHHTFHGTTSTTSSVNKNDGTTTQSETDEKKKDNLATENLTAKKDELNLYVPYVDKAGHVVGHNIETVTLPYSYRHYETDGVSSEDAEDIYTTVTNVDDGNNNSTVATDTKTNIAASETQDTLTVNPGNKWIQAKFEDNELTIAHEIHAINTVAKTSDINSNGDKITVQDIEFDAAGHVIKNQKHTYTLPFGYKNIVTKNTEDSAVNIPASTTGTQSADNTQDTLNLESSNRWIKVDNATEDTVKFGHKLATFIGETKANTHYGLIQNEDHTSNLNTDNEFEVPCFLFDEAGHILEARTHKVTLPELFTSVEIGAVSDDISDTKHIVGTIVADAMTDKLTLNPGNKWIQMTANENDDNISIQHFVKKFNETTGTIDFNTSNSESFDIQQIDWDEAGHLTSSKKVTYSLPKSIKTVDVKNSGIDIINAPTQSNGSLVAETATDTVTVDTGDRWILLQADIDNNKFIISHAAAGNEAKTAGDTTAATPTFGTTFNVPYIKYDEMGHIKSSDVRTVMIPKGSLTDTASNGVANVLTSIGFNATTGAITTTHENVGTLILTGYNLGTDVGAVGAADTVNAAMSKLQAQINKEVNDRALAITSTTADATNKANTAESNAKTYADGLIAALDVTDAAVTSKYVSAVNEVDGKVVVSREDLPTYTLTTGTTGGTVKFNDSEVAVAGLGTAAYTDSNSYASANQGALADSALQLNTPITVGEGEEAKSKTVKELLKIIFELQERITALENQLNPPEPDNTEPTI